MSTNALPAPIASLPTVRVVNLRPLARGTLRALADLELVRAGLIFKNCSWFRHSDGREYIALPSQRYEGQDGVARYNPLVEFAPNAKEARQRFQEAALAAIHSNLTSEGSAA
jgi:hypothetical protein